MKKNKITILLNKAEEFRKENDAKKTKEEINEEVSDLLNKLKEEKYKLSILANKSIGSRKKNLKRNFILNRDNL